MYQKNGLFTSNPPLSQEQKDSFPNSRKRQDSSSSPHTFSILRPIRIFSNEHRPYISARKSTITISHKESLVQPVDNSSNTSASKPSVKESANETSPVNTNSSSSNQIDNENIIEQDQVSSSPNNEIKHLNEQVPSISFAESYSPLIDNENSPLPYQNNKQEVIRNETSHSTVTSFVASKITHPISLREMIQILHRPVVTKPVLNNNSTDDINQVSVDPLKSVSNSSTEQDDDIFLLDSIISKPFPRETDDFNMVPDNKIATTQVPPSLKTPPLIDSFHTQAQKSIALVKSPGIHSNVGETSSSSPNSENTHKLSSLSFMQRLQSHTIKPPIISPSQQRDYLSLSDKLNSFIRFQSSQSLSLAETFHNDNNSFSKESTFIMHPHSKHPDIRNTPNSAFNSTFPPQKTISHSKNNNTPQVFNFIQTKPLWIQNYYTVFNSLISIIDTLYFAKNSSVSQQLHSSREYPPHIIELPLLTSLSAEQLPIFSSIQQSVAQEVNTLNNQNSFHTTINSPTFSLTDINQLIFNFQNSLTKDSFVQSLVNTPTSEKNNNLKLSPESSNQKGNNVQSSSSSSSLTVDQSDQIPNGLIRFRLLGPRKTLLILFSLQFTLLIQRALVLDGLSFALKLITSNFTWKPPCSVGLSLSNTSNFPDDSTSAETENLSPSLLTRILSATKTENYSVLTPPLMHVQELLQSAQYRERSSGRKARATLISNPKNDNSTSKQYSSSLSTFRSNQTNKDNYSKGTNTSPSPEQIIFPLPSPHSSLAFASTLSLHHSLCTVILFILVRWVMDFGSITSSISTRFSSLQSHPNENNQNLKNGNNSLLSSRSLPVIIIIVRNSLLSKEVQEEIDRENQGNLGFSFSV